MSAGGSPLTKEALAEQARFVLQTLLSDATSGTATYLSGLRTRLSRAALVPAEELAAFLEKFGYLLVNRTNNVLSLTKDGELVANGDKFGDLMGDAAHFFDTRLRAAGRGATAPTTRKATGELLDERYRKLGTIGSGGIGSVYRGIHVTTDRTVAIKIVRDVFVYFTEMQRKELVRRLDAVIRATSRLQHPNVVQVLDLNTQREHPYIVSQLAPSGSLRGLLSTDIAISPGKLIAYFVQMCHALRSAHQLGLTHRGLKPENVLIDLYGNIQLSDFGMSRVVERDAGVINQVFVGMGSVAYMAPEQFADATCADARSDIYALGILLYEMCTRRLPGRRSPMPSEVNRELPKGIDDVFDQMTQDAPEDRFGSVQEVLDALYAASGVEALIDRRRAVLFAESPSFDLPLDAQPDGDDPIAEAHLPQGSFPVTLEAASPPTPEQGMPAAPRIMERTEQVRMDVGLAARVPALTEDRIVAPPVPAHLRGDANNETPLPTLSRMEVSVDRPQRPAAEVRSVPRPQPLVDDDFDDVDAGGGLVDAATGVLQSPPYREPEIDVDNEDLFPRSEARIPGSDPRKARTAAVRRPSSTATPGPPLPAVPPRKPSGK